MKANAYAQMANQEGQNWYYAARRRAVETLLHRYVLPETPNPNILDVGCGTGGTTAWLAKFGHVSGIEPSSVAIDLLRGRYPWLDVVQGEIDDLPALVPAQSVDVISLLGVLYHRRVRDPQAALDAAVGALRPGGWILWGDCVYPCLARRHDEFVEGGRRFLPSQMHHMLRTCDCEIQFSSHFLGWGFPAALGMSAIYRLTKKFGAQDSLMDEERESVEDQRIHPLLNSVLGWWTYWEWRVALWGLKLPLGVSRLILARKAWSSTSQRSSPADVEVTSAEPGKVMSL